MIIDSFSPGHVQDANTKDGVGCIVDLEEDSRNVPYSTHIFECLITCIDPKLNSVCLEYSTKCI